MTHKTPDCQPPMPQPLHRPVVWSIAGSDSGGGAGLQADLRALEALGVHGCTAVAAITAQNSVAVECIEPVSATLLEAQLAALAADMPPAAIKTGMLGNAANLDVLVRWIDRLRKANPGLPVVVDPVLRATTGAALADQSLLHAYRTALLPRATLITPNRAEAAALLGCEVLEGAPAVERAAAALLALGCTAVTITGGDDAGVNSEDYAATPQASGWLSLPRVATPHHHGTGCVFASSAAVALARGFVAIDAIILAKMATTHALRHGYAAGSGAGPVRPRTDFALQAQNLPRFSIPGQTSVQGFAALSDPDLGLYAVVDSAAWVQRVLNAGVRTVQLRVKTTPTPRSGPSPLDSIIRDEVRASIQAARAANAQLFINDHWQIAMEEGAYGVHLGQEDLVTADLAAMARAGLRLGISTHAYWEVCRAWALQPSYIACGPIHATQSKDMPWIPQGNNNLAYWSTLLSRSGGLPVVGIAGMNAERVAQAMACGAAGAAVITAITAAPSPEAAIEQLQQAVVAGNALLRQPVPLLPQSTLH
jgi:hydroxymethylpyrimidine kinase / phosphomethylpyrimidine kinase / thiamine-phosphate diphosphorylase